MASHQPAELYAFYYVFLLNKGHVASLSTEVEYSRKVYHRFSIKLLIMSTRKELTQVRKNVLN